MNNTTITAAHSLSEREIKLFEGKPDFKIDTCLTYDHDQSDWAACMNDFGLILSDLRARDTIYHQCKKRYLLLHSKRAELAKIPELANSLCLVLAEALYWLSDYSGSLNFLHQLNHALLGLDSKLTRLIHLVQAISEKSIQEQIAEEGREVDDDGLPVFHLREPMPISSFYLSVQQEDIDSAIREWDHCKADVGEQLAVEIFSRYACVTTNELENVFEIESSTRHRLVRKGFLEKSIAGITVNSKIKCKSRILKILRNTNRCVDEVGKILSDFELYDENFICTLHAVLMDGANIEVYYGDDGLELRSLIIPLGEYRKMGCHTYHLSYGEDEDNEVEVICVQYCSFLKTPILMESYCQEVRKVLEDPFLDVFMKVAWLQWAFLCIHPFGDGNGRVARLISSLPLLKLSLPPVVVLKEKKNEYFNCLDAADRKGDLMPLRNFLRDSLLEGIKFTREVGSKAEPKVLKKDPRVQQAIRK